MLHEFIAEHRAELIRRCPVKVETRSIPPPTPAELEFGVPRFLDQLVDTLRKPLSSISRSAQCHGRDFLLQGYTVSQVVHDYAVVCQSITDLALHLNAPISVQDFRTLNRCLDDAYRECCCSTDEAISLSLMPKPPAMTNAWDFSRMIGNLVSTASVVFEVLRTGGCCGGTRSHT